GHDAAINMIRRLLQAQGAEVVHLGHNRSVAEIVRAAIQEDADAIAATSYQGGHNEYFAYMVDMLRERGCPHIRVVVGGGGTIAPQEIDALQRYGGRAHLYARGRPPDGSQGHDRRRVRPGARCPKPAFEARSLTARDPVQIARAISVLENADPADAQAEQIRRMTQRSPSRVPVIGITGSGGAGKSSLTDELLTRLLRQFPDRQIAVAAMDPTRGRSGGALLGDRIRMNSIDTDAVFMRSLATRRRHLATAVVLKDVIQLYRAAGFDLIIVETAGTGQADSEIVDLVDWSLYVMTGEYGAASQLEKIEMLDYADLIVLNKSDKRGANDSLRDVRKQRRRNHPEDRDLADGDVPVFPTVASRFNDPGVNRLFTALCGLIGVQRLGSAAWETADSAQYTTRRLREPTHPRREGALPGRDRAQRPRRARTDRAPRLKPRAVPRACIRRCRLS
ncbi:methylmalonyl-CoA mutase, large subunit, partial [mine drainage metagenome]